MNRFFFRILAAMIPAILLFAGCIEPPVVTVTQAMIDEDLAQLRALIPVIEAGLALAEPFTDFVEPSSADRISGKTINADAIWDAPGDDPTPAGIYSGATPDAEGWVRYPYTETDFLENLYGSAGYQAEFFLKPYDVSDPETATIFRVKLII